MSTILRPLAQVFCAVIVVLFFQVLATAQAPQSPMALSSQQQEQLRDLASRVLQHADKAGCKGNSCTILVANFTGPSGSTSILGIQLADTVSAQLATEAKGIHIADRRKLQAFLEKERIQSKLLEDDNAARWLAMGQSANFVLVGYLKGERDKLTVRVQLLDASRIPNPKENRTMKMGPVEEASLTMTDAAGELDPAEPFSKAPDPPATAGTTVYHAGVRGTTVPENIYNPNPPYTDTARKVKFQGTLILSLIVSEEGLVQDLWIVRGLPFGLNQAALDTVRNWRFRPSTLEGKPVPVQVPVEVTFRLY